MLVASIGLAGCSQKDFEEPEEVEEIDTVVDEVTLHEITDSIVYDNKQLTHITPISSFEADGAELNVFPHFNKEQHINVKRIVISGNKFWTSVCKDAKQTDNYKKNAKKGYTLVSHEGTTYGYVEIDDEEAYLVTTSDLPSSYVELVLEQLCSTNT